MKMKKKKLMMLLHATWIILLVVFLFALYAYFRPEPTYPKTNSTAHIKGNVDAKINIVEFSDFECPACGVAEPIVEEIFDKYKDEINLEYKHFPLTRIHPFAFKAAEASECASDQGKFWEMHNIMFENQDALEIKNLKTYAKTIGLDTEKFDRCLDSGAKEEIIKEYMREAIRLDIPGTPTFFINGKEVSFQRLDQLYASLENAILEQKNSVTNN